MRPDIEDFEELEAVTDGSSRNRAMSWLVLSVAVAGFGALAYYAYHSGSQTMQNGDVMLVEADSAPIKQVPTDPEGEQFANQDKTIYDAISPNAVEDQVENLLPEPETPVASPQAMAEKAPKDGASAPTTFVNKNLAQDTENLAVSQKPAPLKSPAPAVADSKSLAPVPALTAAIQTMAPSEEDSGEPKFVNESPVAEVKKPANEKPATAPKKETVKTEPEKKEAKKPAEKKLASGGAYQVQLGAFRSEEEAQAHWKKLSGKFASAFRGGSTVMKAELPHGTFYRLRSGGFSSAEEAKAACAKLEGAACFPVAK